MSLEHLGTPPRVYHSGRARVGQGAAEGGWGASLYRDCTDADHRIIDADNRIILVASGTGVSALIVIHGEPYITQAELESVRARPKGGGRPFPSSSSSLLLSSLELSDTKDYEP